MKTTLELKNNTTPINLNKLMEEKKISEETVMNICGVGENTVYRWKHLQAMPSFENYIKLAEVFEVSLDYLLGNTSIKENDIKTYKVSNRIKALREINNYSIYKFHKVTGILERTIKKYETNEMTKPRLATYLEFSNAFGVSLDYLLGFTESKTWDDFIIEKYPFDLISPGGALRVRSKDNVEYALLDFAGQNIIFANNETRSIASEYFKNKKIDLLGGPDE